MCAFPSPELRVTGICHLAYSGHCLSQEARTNAAVSAVSDLPGCFFFYVLATVEVTPLTGMWVIWDVFVCVGIISP